MMGIVEVRDYRASDFEAIRQIHEATQIDYQFPDINAPLFLVKKVVEVDGVIRAAAGAYIQVELYLWLDPTNWGTPRDKMECVELMSEEGFKSLWLQGVEEAVLYLPPGMEKFAKRLEKLGFSPNREGWMVFSRKLEAKSESSNESSAKYAHNAVAS